MFNYNEHIICLEITKRITVDCKLFNFTYYIITYLTYLIIPIIILWIKIFNVETGFKNKQV